MKRSILLTVIAAIVIAVASAIQAQHDPSSFGQLPQPVADQAVWQEMNRLIAANPQFTDPNRLQPGQSVMIPIDSITTWVISVDKWRLAHGTSCMWDIARAKLSGTLQPDWDVQKAQPIEASVVPAKADTVFVTESSPLGWLWAVALAIILLAVVVAYYMSKRNAHSLEDGLPRFVYSRDDQRRYPPVVNGGFTGSSPDGWARQINESHPDLNALGTPTVVRGMIATTNGSDSGKVVVETGEKNPDGTRMVREVTVRNGQEAAQATYPNGVVTYHSWGCINGWVGGKRLGLPTGWTFVPEGQQHRTTAAIALAAGSVAAETADLAKATEQPYVVPSIGPLATTVPQRNFDGPAIRISRVQAANGSSTDVWTVEVAGELVNPIDRILVGVNGNGAEVHCLRPVTK